MLKKTLMLSIVLVFAGVMSSAAQAAPSAADVVLVLPFENTSGKADFNWVGESFADSLSDLLKGPSLTVVSNQERKLIQQGLRVPLSTLPSLATSLKIAEKSRATWLIYGRYTIVPASDETTATINVRAVIVRVKEGRYMTESVGDTSRKIPPLEVTDALGNLQTIQGQLAYKILFVHDGTGLALSMNEMITTANKVPGKAFEAYIKGLLTANTQAREIFFTNALREYARAFPDGVYSEASLELGHLYLNQRKNTEAIAAFERVISASQRCREKAKADNKRAECGDERYAEASFYIGLIFWQQGNYEAALATMRPLTDDLKLTTVYNALGAIAVQAARSEKKNQAKSAALLTEGLDLLKKASDSAPDDANVRFNYSMALFQIGNMVEAAAQLRSTIAAKPLDGDAYYVLAKTLAAVNDPLAETIDNQARQRLTANNRYATLEKEWLKSKTINDIELRVEQPARRDFVSVVLSRKHSSTPIQPTTSESDDLLAKARTFVKNGNDDEALTTLRRVLASEPMSAESYVLLGRIHLRRGDIDQAISSFKTAVFWDNKLVESYVSLGKIYVERGDCMQAKNYAAQAREIDAENQDVLALQRLSERCSK